MAEGSAKPYRFHLINAFSLPPEANYGLRPTSGGREQLLMNHDYVAPLLADVEWDVHPGAPATHGLHPVELRAEFLIVGANRLGPVRQACESGRYNAIVLLGGGDPGFPEAREIGRGFGIPVTSCAHAQMHVASMLGSRFAIIDISEAHNLQMASLVVQYGFRDRCASIRCVNYPLPRPVLPNDRPITEEKRRAEAGEHSGMLEAALRESIDAIEEDGAEVLMLGCSAAFWMAPLLEEKLHAMGWEVPVLEGYRCAIAQAKLLAGMGQTASGLAFPSDHPRRWRRKKYV